MGKLVNKIREKLLVNKKADKSTEIKVKIVSDGWVLKKDGKTEYIRR